MAEQHEHLEAAADDEPPFMLRRRKQEEAQLDITPMIDVTFLLLIFFLVCSVPDPSKAVDLPKAKYGTKVSERESITITLADRGTGEADIYLADGRQGDPLVPDYQQQADLIQEFVEQGFLTGRDHVLLKTERGVLNREVHRVSQAVGRVEGISLHIAVYEVD